MTMEAISHEAQDRAAPRSSTSARVAELLGWASMIDPGLSPSPARREQAMGALAEAADGDGDLLHRAWLAALRSLRDGSTTRSSVNLLRSAADSVQSLA
jgi:hypothetical protein